MTSKTQSTLLQTLGDDWHSSHVYDSLILSIVPSTKYVNEIASALLSIYTDEKNGSKTCTTIPPRANTLFGFEVSRCEITLKTLQYEMEKEGKNLDALAKTFGELEAFVPVGAYQSETEDDDSDEYTQTAEKTKGHQSNVIVKKVSAQEASKLKELKRKILLLKSTKTAMANSQQKLFDLQKEIALFERKISYYNHYCDADIGYICGLKKLVLAYEDDKNLYELIEGLDSLISYSEMIRRRYVPSAPCSGKYKDICETHLLNLSNPVYSSKGEVVCVKCPVAVQ